MPIRVVCRHCGKQFSAWDDLVGKPVKCPKCQGQMLVPGGDSPLSSPPGSPAPPAPTRPAAPISSPQWSDPAPKPPRPAPAPAPQPTVRNLPPLPPVAPRPDAPPAYSATHADDLSDGDELPYACPSCNQPMPRTEDLCDHCGYHRVLKRRIEVEGIKKPDNTVGFERFFKSQLDNQDTAASTLLLMKIVGGLFLLGFLFLCFGWWSLLLVAVGVVAFVILRRKQLSRVKANAEATEINRDFLSTMLWGLILGFQRTFGWRLPAWPFKKTRALTLHDPAFGDDELAELENLSSFETLDLEGTKVTNACLPHLEPLKQLRFIVVRRTNVTPAAAIRLQQALPEAWIWV